MIKTRVQEDNRSRKSKGGAKIWSTAKEVVKSDGVRGLWRGTVPTLYR